MQLDRPRLPGNLGNSSYRKFDLSGKARGCHRGHIWERGERKVNG